MNAEPTDSTEFESDHDGSQTRRGLLKVAAVGLGAAGLAVSTRVEPAFANDPDDITIAATKTNANVSATMVNTTSSLQGAQVVFQSGNDYSSTGVNTDAALAGWASPSGRSLVGVQGFSLKAGGAGVSAMGGGDAATLRLFSNDPTAPTTGTFQLNDLMSANDGVWQCVAAGTPGAWRKLAGSATAGAFHAITPHRVYDSRHATKIGSGETRTVSIADGINGAGAVDAADLVPAGATAISVNVTITATTGGGYLTLFPAGVPRPTASTINWYASGQTAANSLQLAVSTGRQISIYGGGTGTTHVLLDVSGYYL